MPFRPLLEKLADKPVLYGVLSLLKRTCPQTELNQHARPFTPTISALLARPKPAKAGWPRGDTALGSKDGTHDGLGRVYGRETYVAVDAMGHVFRWEVWDLGVDLDEQGRERVDEVFPLLLRDAVYGFCSRASEA